VVRSFGKIVSEILCSSLWWLSIEKLMRTYIFHGGLFDLSAIRYVDETSHAGNRYMQVQYIQFCLCVGAKFDLVVYARPCMLSRLWLQL